MDYTLGLDIGIGSIGAAIITDKKVEYMGVRIFKTADLAKTQRKIRGQRRNLSRKSWRKQQLRDAFDDFKILTNDEMNQQGYLCYTTNKGDIHPPIDRTVYHLRKRALYEQVTKRELLLCLYNILQARGHFLDKGTDFNWDNVSFDDYSQSFFEVCDEYLELSEKQKNEIKKELLGKVFEKKIEFKDLKKAVSSLKIEIEDEQEKILYEIIRLVMGYKANVGLISTDFLVETGKTLSVMDFKESEDEVPPVAEEFIELYDIARIHQVMKGGKNYLCEIAVDKIDKYDDVVNKFGTNSPEFEEMKKGIAAVSKKSNKHYRVVKNLDNSYPNGLYIKEAYAILEKQSEFYPEINKTFIEICLDIISAKIPYYIGPLNENAKNSWVKKGGKFKYSYSYSMNNNKPIDDIESIKIWKDRLRPQCTYLPEFKALPKGSFLAETFNIVNELNILQAEDNNDERYPLTHKDKALIFNNLFLQKDEVLYDEVKSILGLKYYGTKKTSSGQLKFNNKYTLYLSLIKILPELKLNSIDEIFKEKEKVNRIEQILLDLNLYSEKESKIEIFQKAPYNYSFEISKKLSKLKSNSFYNYSKEFIFDEPMNKNGDTLMSLLFENNKKSRPNEQMTLINNAVDQNGKKRDFIANKYKAKLKANDGMLNYSLLMNGDKPVLPMPRTVVRALNECMKLYNEIIKMYGVPNRVVIETARDFPDFQVVKTKNAKLYDLGENLYKDINRQLKEEDTKKEYKKYYHLATWNQIKPYFAKNKLKIKLYLTQMGMDMLTGKAIDITDLDNYQIGHILPQGFGDDSIDNKMLISKTENGLQDNRLPLEYIASPENLGRENKIILSDYIKRVNALYDMKLISEKKYKMLTMEETELDGFINRNLVDTRYIIREFMAMLNAFNEYHKYDTHIVALKSAYTNLYRKAFYLTKVREDGDQHHALDAALVAIADKTLSAYYKNYDSYNPMKSKEGDDDEECELSPYNSYKDFMKLMSLKGNDDALQELKNFIYYTYKIAFNEKINEKESLIQQIKEYIPYYSLKVERNYDGQLFGLKPKKNNSSYADPKKALSVLGVNKPEKNFEKVELVAVDFYKYTDENGEKHHLVIHIPKAIVNNEGIIDKNKYLKLLKDYYKADYLLDKNGNLKEYYFRFRAFNNDIIYDTENNTLFRFGFGSIAHEKEISLNHVNIFSYNEINNIKRDYYLKLVGEFNIRNRKNIKGIAFEDLESKQPLVEYICVNEWGLKPKDNQNENDQKLIDHINKLTEKDATLNALCDHLAFLKIRKERPKDDLKEIKGRPDRIRPYVSSYFTKDKTTSNDYEFVKIKSTILGIRTNTVKGELKIKTPDFAPGQYKKITKEKFTWNLKNTKI